MVLINRPSPAAHPHSIPAQSLPLAVPLTPAGRTAGDRQGAAGRRRPGRGQRLRRGNRSSRIAAIACRFACLLLLGGLAAVAEAQIIGGGIANSVGISIENSANQAANSAAANAQSIMAPPGFGNSGQPSAGSSYDGAPYGSGGGSPYGSGGYGSGMGGPNRSGGGLLQAWSAYLSQPLNPQLAGWNPSLLDQAALAMHVGDERQAWAWFLAHVIAERESSAEALDQLRLSTFQRKPTWAIRSGVSLNVRIPDRMTVNPIRSDSVLQTMRGRGGNARQSAGNPTDAAAAASGQHRFPPPSYPPAGAVIPPAAPSQADANNPNAAVTSANVGSTSGSPGAGYDPALGSNPAALGSDPGAGYDPGYQPGPGSGSPSPGSGYGSGYDSGFVGGIRGSGGPLGGGRGGPAARFANPAYRSAVDTERLLADNLGLVNDIFRTELSARFLDERLGSVFPLLAEQGDELIEQAVLHADGTPQPTADSLSIWQPGFTFVGSENADAMIRKARQQGLDLLFHFEVVVKPARLDQQYDARCRIIDVAAGTNLVTSPLINRQEVLAAARNRENADTLMLLLRPTWESFDEKVQLAPMPALKPEQAVSRVSALLAQPDPGSLPNLAEITYYFQRRLLPLEQYEQAMFIAIGDDGLRLVHAAPETRVEVIKRLVQQHLDDGTDNR